MSHYPTTAELAAFRRRIDSPYASPAGIAYSHGPLAMTDMRESGNYRGAWPEEREHGIGYRESAPDAMCIVRADGASHTGIVARQRASAMRSRAYARALSVTGCEDCILMGNLEYPHVADSDTFVMPESWVDPWTSSDHWTEDDPRTTLPIVYHQPIGIIA